MSEPTEQELLTARLRGEEAGDLRNASAVENPYDVATQRGLHNA